MTTSRVPYAVLDGTASWAVRRAWPDRDRVVLELSSPRSPSVRPGVVTAEHGPQALALGADPGLPDLERVAHSGRVLSHRLGKRAVVRSFDGTFIKVVRPGRSRAVVDGMADAAHFRSAFRVPEVLAADGGAVTMSAVSGRSFHAWAGSVDVVPTLWEDMWRGWSRAWQAATAQSSVHQLPEHGPDAEAQVLIEWADRLPATVPVNEVEGVRSAAVVIGERLLSAPSAALVPGHRDLHDKQLLWSTDGGIALIDLDTAARCEPALDVANLRAHVHLRHLQGVYSEAQADTARAIVDETAWALEVPSHRLQVYELATLLRLGCLYAWRPGWVGVARRLRAEVADALDLVDHEEVLRTTRG